MTVQTADTPQIFEYDYYQKLYEIEEGHWWALGMRDVMTGLFQKALAGRTKLRVLDVGCGTGYLLNFMERYSLDGEVVGIDYSAHALKFCQTRGAAALALASAVKLPFAAGAFDLIICIDTVQHLWPAGADQAATDEFARLLRRGGYAYIRTNSARGHVKLEGADPNLYRRYYLSDLKTMARKAGLEVERATYLNCLPSVWAMLREYMTARRQKTAAIGPGLAIRPNYSPTVNNLLHKELSFEAWVINRLGIDLPFGHSTGILAKKP